MNCASGSWGAGTGTCDEIDICSENDVPERDVLKKRSRKVAQHRQLFLLHLARYRPIPQFSWLMRRPQP